MKSPDPRPALGIESPRELNLDGDSLLSLMGDVLSRGVPFRFRAGGYSMSPFIRDGDVVTVFPKSGKNPKRGDVVAYLRPVNGRPCVHRIVGESAEGFAVKGDHETETDFPVAERNIFGIVRKVERHGRCVRIGLGPERKMIARLSVNGSLSTFFGIVRLFRRKASGGGK